MTHKSGIESVAVVLLSVVLGGCACRGTDLIAAGRLTVEPRIDHSLREPPAVCDDGGDLTVSGRLASGARSAPGSYIDITVVDPSGAVIDDARLIYMSMPVSTGKGALLVDGSYRRGGTRRSHYDIYSARFHGLPPEGSVVRIIRQAGTSGTAGPPKPDECRSTGGPP